MTQPAKIEHLLDAARQHHQAGRLAEAESLYRQVLAQRPEDAAVSFLLANALRDAGRLHEAIEAYDRALSLQPRFLPACVNLGTVWTMLGRWDEAVAAYRRALTIESNIAEVHYNLGNALECLCLWDEALEAHRRAVALRPDNALMRHHLGVALYNLGRLDEAMAAYRLALQMQPDLAKAHCDLAELLLLQGDLRQGWKEFEWRWRVVDRLHPRLTDQSQWDGSDPAGRRILLHVERAGHGDAIHYFRYAPLIARRGARVIVQCQPQLVRLLRTLDGVEQVLGSDQPPPEFDVHCSLFSLPRVMDTTLQTIPADVPYLRADPVQAERWRKRLAADDDDRLKVGLVWAGGTGTAHDRIRSMALASLAPLADLRSLRLFSLQKGEPAQQVRHPPAGLEITDWTAELNDWADTAALLVNLDLLVSVDTAVAHLAGALGKRVWVLLQMIPDPRWLLHRQDTPWYPTMRLFRQVQPNDWSTPVQQLVEALSAL
ncbi:MAG: tetratricopeptide repeat-containing glycosyltransferase family protein [Tepidisphaeraceae bacterium]